MENEIRKLSIDVGQVVGEGHNSHVYLLDDSHVVKIMDRWYVPQEIVAREKRNADDAYKLGITTPKACELVRVDDSYGIVYEKIDANTVQNLVASDPSQMSNLVRRQAAMLKWNHSIEVPEGMLMPLDSLFREKLQQVSCYMTEHETKLIGEMLDSLSGRHTYIHGDYQYNNVMVDEKKMYLIDMFNSSYGHPMYDLMSTYMFTVYFTKYYPELAEEAFPGWGRNLLLTSWKVFLEEYFTDSKFSVEKWDEVIAFYGQMRFLTYLKKMNMLSDERRNKEVEKARVDLFPYVHERLREYKVYLDELV